MTFLAVYQASCGQILMKISGNQAGAFPDLPMQPGNLDFSRITGKLAKEISYFFRRTCFYPRIVLIALYAHM